MVKHQKVSKYYKNDFSYYLTIFLISFVSEQLFFITGTYKSSYRRYSIKNLFLKVSQYSQENIYDGVSLIKLQAFRAATKENPPQVNIAKFLRAAILKNICERLLLHLTNFSKQFVFREAIFRNSLSNIIISNLYFTFVSLNTFISLNNDHL